MSENKHRNPFEHHINSDLFDVTHLGSVQERNDFDNEMKAFFDSLPDESYERELDPRQQAICNYLGSVLSQQVLRDKHGETLDTIDDEDLKRILTAPIAMAMLAQQRLNQPEPVPEPDPYIAPSPEPYYNAYSELPPNFGDILNDKFLKFKDFVVNLFRRT